MILAKAALLVLATTLVGCFSVSDFGPAVKGSGVAKAEDRDVQAFKRIQIDGGTEELAALRLRRCPVASRSLRS